MICVYCFYSRILLFTHLTVKRCAARPLIITIALGHISLYLNSALLATRVVVGAWRVLHRSASNTATATAASGAAAAALSAGHGGGTITACSAARLLVAPVIADRANRRALRL